MEFLTRTLSRLNQSAVMWSWAMNGLRLTSGIIVLPLLLQRLSEADLGMYFVLLGFSAVVPTLDFGFSVSIGRAVSYAMGGAKELTAQSFVPDPAASGPNQQLLGELLATTRRLYQWIALATFGLLGLVGTIIIATQVAETDSAARTWAAWSVTLVATTWEIYAGWWNVYLRSMNQVRRSMQQVVLALAVKIGLSALFLVAGAGLLAVPVATLLASFVQRLLSRRSVLQLLGGAPAAAGNVKQFVATLWPNTWRLGVYYLGGYLNSHALMILCPLLVGLATATRYQFTFTLINIAASMAQVWTVVKWPAVGQLRVQQKSAVIGQLLWPRLWLQAVTFLVVAAGVGLLGPITLQWLHSDKSLLPPLLLGLLALTAFCELHCTFWNTLIASGNRLPMVWPTIISNGVSLLIMLLLVRTTDLGLAAFVLAPLGVGLAYNFWKWPIEGARSIETTWLKFMLRRG